MACTSESTLESRFALGEIVGVGGTGVVRRARHRRTGCELAVKTAHAFIPADEARAALRAEGHVLARTRHPNVVRVLDLEDREGFEPYLVCELLEGESIAQRLGCGPASVSETIGVGVAILRALQAVHEAGFLHNDVKPANIVVLTLRDRLVPKLVDFGLSSELSIRSSGTSWVGTRGFSAPERLRGEPGGAASDVFSLAGTLYRMLTGQRPDLEVPIRRSRPEVSPDLEAVIMRGLAWEPAARWGTAADMADALVAASHVTTRASGIVRIRRSSMTVGLENDTLLSAGVQRQAS